MELSARRLFEPMHEAPFRRLAGGRLVSVLGDWLVAAALVGWIYAETGSTAEVALLLLVRLIPLTLGSGIAAGIADRFERRRLLIWVEAGRTAVALGVAAAVVSGSRLAVYAAVAALSLLTAVAGVTVRALAPACVSARRLPAANAQLAVAQETAMALGALAAGLTLSEATVGPALVLAALAFALATCAYIRVVPAAPAVVPRAHRTASLLAGVRHLRERRVLAVVVTSFAAATLATGLVNASLPRYLGEHGLGPGGYGYGLCALATGLLLGEAAAGLARLEGVGVGAFGSLLALMGAGLAAMAAAPDARAALLLLGLVGFADGISEVLFETIAQREANPAFYGRVFGFSSSLMRTTMLGSVAAAPLVNAFAAPGTVLLTAGAALAVVGAVTYRCERRDGHDRQARHEVGVVAQ